MMDILFRLGIIFWWFSVVVISSVGCWSAIIWLLNRKLINDKGAAAICFTVAFGAVLLCSRYQ